MSALPSDATSPAPGSWWMRLYRWLMPDYNRKAAVYWWAMALLGCATLAYSVHKVAALPFDALLYVVAGIAIAALAGVFPVRIPRSKNSFAAGEIFIFLLLLLNGPAAAALAAAAEAGVGAWRTSKRWTSRIASPTMAAVAMFAAGSLFQTAIHMLKARSLFNEGALLVLAVVFAAFYFLINTLLVTLVVHLKRNQPPVWRDWLGSFGWVGIAHAGSASVAVLLFLTFQQFGIGILLAATPIIGALLSTLHFFFRQRETDERIHKERVEAAERESAQVARHVRALEDSEARFHSAFTHASIGMALVGVDGKVLQVNHALCSLLGHAAPAVVGHPFTEFLFVQDVEQLTQQLDRVIEHEIEAASVELRWRHKAGHEVWVALNCGRFSDPRSNAPCLIVQVQDITARRQAESRLQNIAYHDGLTGLPNRNRFNECLRQAIARTQEDPRHHFSVMFLDFDRFKMINDSLGHGAGDELLVKVARRILENVRPNDVVARLGGDEFAILTEDMERERHAINLAERLQQVLRRPIELSDTEITTSVSIGITFSGFGYRKPEEVLRDADIAMYRAKATGKARYAVFDATLHAQVSEQLHLEGELRRAIEGGQLSLAYQPLYQLSSGRLTGFEALARWQHPERGAISPATFIPIAEESGLIVPISDYILDNACRQLKQWQTKDSAFVDLEMQVNISGHDLMQSAFARRATKRLLAAGLDPAHLTLEITESMLMQRLDSAVDTMEQLREMGIGLSVDDFGTGYSSLAYLTTLPINSLKIDRSFVNKMQASAQNSEIVKAVVMLGNALGKSVIAEGIETPAQLDRLRDMGCEYGQGYLLARPLSAAQAGALLETGAAVPRHHLDSARLPLLV